MRYVWWCILADLRGTHTLGTCATSCYSGTLHHACCVCRADFDQTQWAEKEDWGWSSPEEDLACVCACVRTLSRNVVFHVGEFGFLTGKPVLHKFSCDTKVELSEVKQNDWLKGAGLTLTLFLMHIILYIYEHFKWKTILCFVYTSYSFFSIRYILLKL